MNSILLSYLNLLREQILVPKNKKYNSYYYFPKWTSEQTAVYRIVRLLG